MSDVALVTGTSQGLGAHLATHLLSRGLTVYGCSRKAAAIVHERYHHVIADVTSEKDVRHVVATIASQAQRLDVLINNAGVASLNHALLTPLSSVHKIFDTNVVGTFLFCREATRLLRKSGHGRIVNLGSVAAPLRVEGESIYAASKSAVVTLTQVLARELAPFHITCNVVAPTPIDTALTRSVPPEKIAALVERQAIKRLGEPSDVANVVDFFLRPESAFITGQVIHLGGVS